MTETRVLIIDDNSANILVLEQLLGIEGAVASRLAVSPSLYEDLHTLADIAVVFLDIEMPRMNGYQVLDVIKSHPNFLNTPVIAYSVHVSEVSVAMDRGFDGFLGKPLSAEAFPNQLQRILNGEKVHYVP